jgi:hypothetical protein
MARVARAPAHRASCPRPARARRPGAGAHQRGDQPAVASAKQVPMSGPGGVRAPSARRSRAPGSVRIAASYWRAFGCVTQAREDGDESRRAQWARHLRQGPQQCQCTPAQGQDCGSLRLSRICARAGRRAGQPAWWLPRCPRRGAGPRAAVPPRPHRGCPGRGPSAGARGRDEERERGVADGVGLFSAAGSVEIIDLALGEVRQRIQPPGDPRARARVIGE